MENLSKSRYTTFCWCDKKLWLSVYKPEVGTVDDASKSRMETGTEVGKLARGFFGDYTDVTTTNAEGKLDLEEMVRKTKELIDNGVENIAEASFLWEGNYCAVDILHKQNGGYAICEVKSSSSGKGGINKKSKMKQYAPDIAYQKYVLENAGINVTGTYLVLLNSDYEKNGELDVQKLFEVCDAKDFVDTAFKDVAKNAQDAKNMLKCATEPKKMVSKLCRNCGKKCEFENYCKGDVPENSVFDLYNIHFETAANLFNNGCKTIEEYASKKNVESGIIKTQIECTLKCKDHIDKEGIRVFLEKIKYPIYFLDFESEMCAIPKYDGTKPYQQVIFQYSLHYIEEEGGELKHKEFLGDPRKGSPLRDIAESLCKDIPMNVCVTVFNKGFECPRLEELAKMFPDLSVHLLNIAEHVVDFLDPFRAGYYYRPAMKGSFSIKAVLPALFPDDPELDYHNLNGDVHNGGEAMTIYPKMAEMAEKEYEKARKDLLEYCKLDTYAMVKVWRKLVEVSK